jgi:hypothetical protein
LAVLEERTPDVTTVQSKIHPDLDTQHRHLIILYGLAAVQAEVQRLSAIAWESVPSWRQELENLAGKTAAMKARRGAYLPRRNHAHDDAMAGLVEKREEYVGGTKWWVD